MNNESELEGIKMLHENKETIIAQHFGVSRSKLVEYRKEAQETIHWYRKEDRKGGKGAVCWTAEGVTWLEAKEGSKAKTEATSEKSTKVDVYGRVTQKPLNKKLLLCEVRGQSCKVLVRDSKLFKVGMFIPLKEISSGMLTVTHYPKRFGQY